MCSAQFVRRSNRQKFCEGCKERRKRQYSSAYVAANADKILVERRAYMRERKKKDPEHVLALGRKWYEENKDEINRRRRLPVERSKKAAYARRRYAESPDFALHVRMSAAIYAALKDKKAGRKWEGIVGYSADDLAKHIERQFLNGMGWHNMGEWHIDHIVPRSSFSFVSETDPEFRACWALTNLRPMWAKDNMKKHAKRTHLL